MCPFLRKPRAALSGSLVVLATLLLTSAAPAQVTASNPAGSAFGIRELDNSGQVGEITLYGRGKAATSVVVRIVGSNGRRERAGIYRGETCTGIGQRAYALKPILPGGFSRSTVGSSVTQLESGSYVVVVFASLKAGARPVACGDLYS
jgi:hypothetical protein